MKNISKTTMKAALLGACALGLGATSTLANPTMTPLAQEKGKKVTETRKVSGFTRIEQAGSSDVVVKVGGTFKVEIKADNRIIDDIETYVEDGTLVIRREDRRRRSWFRSSYGATVYVTLPSLEGFDSRGSGDAYVEGVKANDFDLSQNGSGDVELEGSCTTGDISINGSGDLEARDFKCESLDVSTNGSGDMRIYATKNVDVSSHGSGDVDIYGGARLGKLRTRGSGDIETH